MIAQVPVAGTAPLSRTKRLLFTVIAVLLPFALLGVTELVLRVTWPGGAIPLFVPAVSESRAAQISVNALVARRWFFGRSTGDPPGAIVAPFALHKAPHTLRIFAMGESTTAGFPYPHSATFSYVLQRALQDALPSDSVEIINVGIAATSSYAMVDEADEIVAQHPDAVIIYAGHNEFYGALGVGSTESLLGGLPALVRTYLRLQRLRSVMALRNGVRWAGRVMAARGEPRAHTVTLMETLVGSQEIPLGGELYDRGQHQFESNLGVLLDRFRNAHVPVFIGSQASNVREQHPFASASNARPGGADSVYAEAQRDWERHDSAAAAALFVRARDLDVVRFRASSGFNQVIRDEAAAHAATYVPVAERFAAASPGGAPGHDLFLEHLHPNTKGILVMAHAYFDAIAMDKFLGRTAQPKRVRKWDEYASDMELSPFDERIVALATDAVAKRWPFVPVNQQVDVRREFRVSTFEDSLVVQVAAGGSWQGAKLSLAQWYARNGFADSAAIELHGVAVRSPNFAEPWEYLAQAFMRENKPDSAFDAYRHALAIRPSAASAQAAAGIALKRGDYAAAIPMLQLTLSVVPDDPGTLYALSLAYAFSHDAEHARAAGARLAQVAPNYPGLGDWLRTIGLSH